MKIKRVEHVAIAVRNMTDVMRMFQDTFGLALEYEEDFPKTQTKIAMYPVGQTYLELLQGGPDSKTAQWIAEKGESLYHICFEVDDIDGAIAELRAKGVALIDEQPRIGHGGSRIAFIDPRSTANILIELAEIPAQPAH